MNLETGRRKLDVEKVVNCASETAGWGKFPVGRGPGPPWAGSVVLPCFSCVHPSFSISLCPFLSPSLLACICPFFIRSPIGLVSVCPSVRPSIRLPLPASLPACLPACLPGARPLSPRRRRIPPRGRCAVSRYHGRPRPRHPTPHQQVDTHDDC